MERGGTIVLLAFGSGSGSGCLRVRGAGGETGSWAISLYEFVHVWGSCQG